MLQEKNHRIARLRDHRGRIDRISKGPVAIRYMIVERMLNLHMIVDRMTVMRSEEEIPEDFIKFSGLIKFSGFLLNFPGGEV